MKQSIEDLVRQSIDQLAKQKQWTVDQPVAIQIDRTRSAVHGDFACNIAMILAKQLGKPPRGIAEQIVAALPPSQLLERVEIAGPGFINFFVTATASRSVINAVFAQAEGYGRGQLSQEQVSKGQRVIIEYVSANPTGPLHIGHGRGAAYGAVIANLLEATGYQVHREYYVNDAGRQMNILTVSVLLRYLERLNIKIPFPANGYHGDYIKDIAAEFHQEQGEYLQLQAESLSPSNDKELDDEAAMDKLIEHSQALLGPERYETLQQYALSRVLDGIKQDLSAFGVEYDEWFSERQLVEDQSVSKLLTELEDSGHIYEKDGARWFNSSAFGDEKDRVVIRENGQTTYFASDIAYHQNKLLRGFDLLIDIWGADHHGYIPRVKAAMAALGADPERTEVSLVQFATLYRGKERVKMSTRSGEFVTLRELCDEVGTDAARFFYVMRRAEQHLDFDLELAKSQSNDNPVYYIQYAHARICSVLRQLTEKGMQWDQAVGDQHLNELVAAEEQALLTTLARYPEVVNSAAATREPHQLCQYLRQLANDFHVYYNTHQFLVDALGLRNARLNLILAVRQVIANGLTLLGVTTPEVM